MYEKRNEILDNESIHDTIIRLFNEFISHLVESHLEDNGTLTGKKLKWNIRIYKW